MPLYISFVATLLSFPVLQCWVMVKVEVEVEHFQYVIMVT